MTRWLISALGALVLAGCAGTPDVQAWEKGYLAPPRLLGPIQRGVGAAEERVDVAGRGQRHTDTDDDEHLVHVDEERLFEPPLHQAGHRHGRVGVDVATEHG